LKRNRISKDSLFSRFDSLIFQKVKNGSVYAGPWIQFTKKNKPALQQAIQQFGLIEAIPFFPSPLHSTIDVPHPGQPNYSFVNQAQSFQFQLKNEQEVFVESGNECLKVEIQGPSTNPSFLMKEYPFGEYELIFMLNRSGRHEINLLVQNQNKNIQNSPTIVHAVVPRNAKLISNQPSFTLFFGLQTNSTEFQRRVDHNRTRLGRNFLFRFSWSEDRAVH